MPTLKINPNDENLLKEANINPTGTPRDTENNFIIKELKQKLQIIGAHYMSISNKTTKLGNRPLNNIVKRECEKIIVEIEKDRTNGNTICQFNTDNPAQAPSIFSTEPNYFTNEKTVRTIFHNLNNKISSGTDNIPNRALKHITKNIALQYTIIFNNMLNHNYFPNYWKIAKTISIPKKEKDKTQINSYRLISLLPNISKIYEKVINQNIIRHSSKHNIIPDYQFGFRRHHSTSHAINKVVSDTFWALNGKKCVGACLIDLEKAFDTVWLEGLIFKLIKKNFPIYLIKLIWNMIHNRKFRTYQNYCTSEKTFTISNRLQQGTINSPTLFNIYTADLLICFGPVNTDCTLIAYADDLIVYTADKKPSVIKNKLQNAIDKILYYYNAWKFKVNLSKCETILFRPSTKAASANIKKHYKNFNIIGNVNDKTVIPHKKTVKYLGIQLDERLHLNQHVELQLEKAKRTFISLGNLFYARNLNRRVKITCYQALIRPIITYACEIWYNLNAANMETIRKFERKCIRACTNTYRSKESNYTKYTNNLTFYNTAQIHRIDCFTIQLIRRYFKRLSEIKENSLIYSIPCINENYIINTLKTGFIPPEAFIYLDANGYITDKHGIPIIYHIPRHKKHKTIIYNKHIDSKKQETTLKYDTTIPNRDKLLSNEKNTKQYWWLKRN
ncbi:PREDICTED: RNA-directed DNA polymerase from mobile element jockey-like [Dinoponera quadriceps]|uniref:RNA-directed DNA polymerase from mobile element jockey-like n=1 Tax=Dinoponera quadriceps TaxID=609295 RepID=A0A6P3X9F2_DINQU|nr:PREDICTED: RNA-directed DNA polymerase from mobile element jockey-like [Dinoponera quadriceps]